MTERGTMDALAALIELHESYGAAWETDRVRDPIEQHLANRAN